MPVFWGDTFVVGADTLLQNHTPTGANPGSGWLKVGTGDFTVLAATDRVDLRAGNGYYLLENELPSADMYVSADFSFTGTNGYCGLVARGRRDTVVPTTAGVFFSYDEAAAEWRLFEYSPAGGASNLVSSSEIWDGSSTKHMQLEVIGAVARGVVDGVEKCKLNLLYGHRYSLAAGLGANAAGTINPFADNFFTGPLPGGGNRVILLG